MTTSRSNADVERRRFLGLGALGATLGIAGCIGAGFQSQSGSEGWSNPGSNQRQVMLLGTIHLAISEAGAGGNLMVHDAGDVLGEQRQQELETLTDRLIEWEPDRIAVEFPYDRQPAVDQAYAAYRDDALDALPDDIEPADEIVQIGCRLAAKLDQERMASVDYPQSLAALLTEAERQRLAPLNSLLPDPSAVDYPLPDVRVQFREEQQMLDEQALPEFYRHLNRLDRARTNDEILFSGAIGASDPGSFAPMKVLTAWYQRNLRIVSNLWNAIPEGNERVLLVFGASHLPSLKYFLDTAPMFAPVDPKPYLQP
ncbi:DUF5694 domain-containing protein [Salinirubellus litoreus]|uniref:DUF5694 domain-containing protein n=1 Tax=Salinirubellus litoreus TaxID=3131999 RepID=UPI0030D1EC3B